MSRLGLAAVFLAGLLGLSCVSTSLNLVPRQGDTVVSLQSLLNTSKSEAGTPEGLRIRFWPGPKGALPPGPSRPLEQTSLVVQERRDLRDRGLPVWDVTWTWDLGGATGPTPYVLRFQFRSDYDTDKPGRLVVDEVRQLTWESSRTGRHSLGDFPRQISRTDGWSPGWVPGDRFRVRVSKGSLWGALAGGLPFPGELFQLGSRGWIGDPPSRFEVEIDGKTAAELQAGVVVLRSPFANDEGVLEEALVFSIVAVIRANLDVESGL